MKSTALAATTNWLLKPFALLLGLIFNGLFAMINGWTDSQSLGISIILFTFLVRLLMTPLMYNQQRSTRRMTRLQPKVQKIQDKYKGKTDPESNQRMQAEIQALYKENKANPMAGCLPLLIQMPIIFALFEVLRNVPFYVTSLGDLYREMTAIVQNVNGYDTYMTEAFATVIKGLRNFDISSADSVMDLLYHLNGTQYAELIEKLGLASNEAFQTAYSNATHLNTFGAGVLTFNLCENPGIKGWSIVIPILAGLSTFLMSFITTYANEKRQKMASPDGIADQTQKSMKMMNYIFPFMTAYFAINMPAGLGLYWIASNLFGIISQVITDRVLDREEYNEALKRRDEIIAKREAAAQDKSRLDKTTGGRLGAASNAQSKTSLAGGKRMNKPAAAPVVVEGEAVEVKETAETVETAETAETVETVEVAETVETAETAETAVEEIASVEESISEEVIPVEENKEEISE